jgi:pilus assembly protein CpaB
MKRRALLLLAALAIAVTGTLLVFAYASKTRAASAAPEEQVPVLQALKLIPAGTTGRQMTDLGLVQLTELPIRAVPAGALTDLVPVTDLAVSTDVQPGEMLFQGNFGDPQQLAGLQIPADKMAVSVQLADPQRVAGFVKPGSEIAVFATYAVKDLDQGRTGDPTVEKATRLLLPRAEVLAVGADAFGSVQPPADASAETTQTAPAPQENVAIVTLAVTVEEAQKVAHGATTGELYLALLSPQSRSQTGPAVDNRNLFD